MVPIKKFGYFVLGALTSAVACYVHRYDLLKLSERVDDFIDEVNDEIEKAESKDIMPKYFSIPVKNDMGGEVSPDIFNSESKPLFEKRENGIEDFLKDGNGV